MAGRTKASSSMTYTVGASAGFIQGLDCAGLCEAKAPSVHILGHCPARSNHSLHLECQILQFPVAFDLKDNWITRFDLVNPRLKLCARLHRHAIDGSNEIARL